MSAIKIITCFVCCLSTVSLFAETQYWATVGSYKNAASAEKASGMAQTELGDQYSVVSTSTDKGNFYRVVSGPFLTRDLADDRVRAARNDGYATAWVWVDGANSTALVTELSDYSSDTSTAYDSASTYIDTSLTDSYSDDIYASDNISVEPREIEESDPVPELVDKAPADYNLNRMIRDS